MKSFNHRDTEIQSEEENLNHKEHKEHEESELNPLCSLCLCVYQF